MVSIFNLMTKTRWHPLPIDSQVVAAIEDRKSKFIESFPNYLDRDMDDNWVFKHICTVLDHAQKIFEMDEKTFCSSDLRDNNIFKQTK